MDRDAKNAYARAWYRKHQATIRNQIKHRRRNNVARTILADARKADRRMGVEFDLNLTFVIRSIAQPCVYCGDTDLRRTLDRIENTKGHTRTNVVVACERCNYVRRNMPYEAWLAIAPAMRDARERGLFGGWTGSIHRRDPLPPLMPSLKEPAPHGTLTRYPHCGPPRCQLCRDAMAAWKRKRRKELASS